jgi:hypothetical protein
MGKKKYVEKSAVLRIDIRAFKVTYDMKVSEIDESEHSIRVLEKTHEELPLDKSRELLARLSGDELAAYTISPDGNIILFYFYERLR